MSRFLFQCSAVALFLGAATGCISAPFTEGDVTGKGPTPYTPDLPPWMTPMPIPADNPFTEQGIALGRQLFYDTLLSSDRTISCASCHQQQHAFSDPRQFSVGVRGQLGKRQAMPLFNLAWDDAFFWDGRAATIEEQVLVPLQDPIEMDRDLDILVADLQQDPAYVAGFDAAFPGQSISPDLIAKALGQFVRSITSFRSRWDSDWKETGAVSVGNPTYKQDDEVRGHDAMRSTNDIETNGTITKLPCDTCHQGSGGVREDYFGHHGGLFKSNGFRNNGRPLDPNDAGRAKVTGSDADLGKWKVPAIRNLSMTAPFMHDGRFATIEEVLRFYADHVEDHPLTDEALKANGKPIKLTLTEDEIDDVLAFFKMLDDPYLKTNPMWSNPFPEQE